MTKNNQCKLEFYFTRANIQKLLDENPLADGIIVSQEIKVRRTSDNQTINIVEIKARAEHKKGHTDSSKSRSIDISSTVDGCPEPPGCL